MYIIPVSASNSKIFLQADPARCIKYPAMKDEAPAVLSAGASLNIIH